MRLRRTPAAIVAFGAAAALAITGCSSSSSSSASSTSSSSAPAQLTVWRMGGSVPSQVTWMNGVVAQFHKNFPQYANTKVNVVWVPWTSRTTDWNDALASGKNAPDITELGNTGSTSGGANTDFGLGKLDLYIDGPWATATMPANSVDKSDWASFPIPSQNGPNTAPVFAGGSDLAVFKTSKYPQADWDLISVMDNTANSTSFANLQASSRRTPPS